MRGDLRQNYLSNCFMQNVQFLLLAEHFSDFFFGGGGGGDERFSGNKWCYKVEHFSGEIKA